MSLEKSENVNCPNCGRDIVVTFWSTINVSLDPTLRGTLFNGEINQFKCEACGHEGFLNGPLLYHDMERGFCVQYYPSQAIEETGFFESFEPSYPAQIKGIPTMAGEYLAKPHIVFDMDDLIYCVMFYERLLSSTE